MTRAAGTAEAARATRTRLLLEGPVGPTLARLAAPNVVAMLVSAATSIAEGWFAAASGVSALAGLALVFPLVMLTQMLSAGSMGGAISAAVARALGAGDAARAGRVALAAWIIGLGFAALSLILVLAFGRPLFLLIGGGAAAPAAEGMAYATVYFAGAAAIWLCHATLSVIRGTGNMGAPSTILLFVALGSIPLSGALALGFGPLPAFGMAGIAAGAVIAHAGGAAAGLFLVLSGRAGLPLRGALAALASRDFADILRVGLVASLNAIQTVLTIVLMVALVSRFGEAALAGYGLGARLEFLMVPVVFGIGAALTAMVGANIGAGNRARALRIAWTGAFAAAALVGGIGLLVAAFPALWLGLFLDRGAAAWAAGEAYLRIVAPFYFFFGLGLALYFASQGAGRMLWPVLSGLLRMAVAFGLALALTGWFGFGVEGVFLGVAAGMAVFGAATAAAIRLGAWGGGLNAARPGEMVPRRTGETG
ncbi:MAG: MATE family efflux transporter [Pikeienuella sp.]|uniref:MATE family efflux transporter n=1 Tax=Pikeienuella sp. TaxID=2831957 RepID=UPI00391B04E4